MNKKGLLRLWLVVATISIAFLSIFQFRSDSRTWRAMDNASINFCTSRQFNQPGHPDSLQCIAQFGADKTIFQHERLSAGAYWLEKLAVSIAIVIAATAIIFGVLIILRWIMRGFADSMTVEDWWGCTFEKRGSISIRSIPGDLSMVKVLRRLSTDDVAELYRSEGAHDHPSARGLLAREELQRRASWTARAALVVSILAFFAGAVR